MTIAQSSGDGTVDNGDHDFSRYNVHVQTGDSMRVALLHRVADSDHFSVTEAASIVKSTVEEAG